MRKRRARSAMSSAVSASGRTAKNSRSVGCCLPGPIWPCRRCDRRADNIGCRPLSDSDEGRKASKGVANNPSTTALLMRMFTICSHQKKCKPFAPKNRDFQHHPPQPEARHEGQVDRPVAEHLIGDMNVATLGIA